MSETVTWEKGYADELLATMKAAGRAEREAEIIELLEQADSICSMHCVTLIKESQK